MELDVGGRAVRLSNPDKVYFPERGFTKLDVAHYYLAVGGRDPARPARPADHPAALPDGVEGELFYQKRAPKNLPDWIPTARIAFPSGRHADEMCPTELAAVLWAANLGSLTFHPWPVRRADTDHPDELRIDLDPQPGTDYADAVRAAHELRALLDGARAARLAQDLRRARHARLRADRPGVDVHRRSGASAIAVGRELERRMPDRVTTAWWKEERGERIFVDYNQTARDRTIASRLLGAPQPARARSPRRCAGRSSPTPSPRTSTCAPCPPRYAEVGDVHADMDDHAFRLDHAAGAGRPATNASTGWATCPIRRTTRRCRASRNGCSPAAPGTTAATATHEHRTGAGGASPARRGTSPARRGASSGRRGAPAARCARQASHAGREVGAYKTSPYVPAFVLVLILAAAAGLFAGSYTYAMADPTPRQIPCRGRRRRPGQGRRGVHRRDGEGARRLPATAPVRHPGRGARGHGGAEGLRDPAATGQRVAMDIAGAAGPRSPSCSRRPGRRSRRSTGVPVTITDVKPLQKGDPRGLALFYISLAAVIVGFVGAIQLSVHARALNPASGSPSPSPTPCSAASPSPPSWTGGWARWTCRSSSPG